MMTAMLDTQYQSTEHCKNRTQCIQAWCVVCDVVSDLSIKRVIGFCTDRGQGKYKLMHSCSRHLLILRCIRCVIHVTYGLLRSEAVIATRIIDRDGQKIILQDVLPAQQWTCL